MRIPILAICLTLACGGQEPSTIGDVLAGSWSVTMGSPWSAEWTAVSVKNGDISGGGTLIHNGVDTWHLIVGGHTVSGTHAMVRMDAIPNSPTLRPFIVFCEVDLESMDTMDGYVAGDTMVVGDDSLLQGALLKARKL